MGRISDIVRDSKLETRFQGRVTRHRIRTSDPSGRQRKVILEQKWRKTETLGKGAFGVVWKEVLVEGESKAKERAVKMIGKHSRGLTQVDYSRELEAIAKLSHPKYNPYFVESYGWFDSREDVFITMEFFANGDLQKYLDNCAVFPESEAQQVSFQVVEGLIFMHENGFAHRDLKPSNILVKETGPQWWVKIADFGITKRAEDEGTAFRTFGGTPGFLAPEILAQHGLLDVEDSSDQKTYNSAVDIWSLGEIIYRCLCGESPFKKSLSAYVNGAIPFPTAKLLEYKVSEEALDLIQRLMMANPDLRMKAEEAARHPWFAELHSSPRSSDEFSSFEEGESRVSYIGDSSFAYTEPSGRWSTVTDGTTDVSTASTNPTLYRGKGPQRDEASGPMAVVSQISLQSSEPDAAGETGKITENRASNENIAPGLAVEQHKAVSELPKNADPEKIESPKSSSLYSATVTALPPPMPTKGEEVLAGTSTTVNCNSTHQTINPTRQTPHAPEYTQFPGDTLSRSDESRLGDPHSHGDTHSLGANYKQKEIRSGEETHGDEGTSTLKRASSKEEIRSGEETLSEDQICSDETTYIKEESHSQEETQRDEETSSILATNTNQHIVSSLTADNSIANPIQEFGSSSVSQTGSMEAGLIDTVENGAYNQEADGQRSTGGGILEDLAAYLDRRFGSNTDCENLSSEFGIASLTEKPACSRRSSRSIQESHFTVASKGKTADVDPVLEQIDDYEKLRKDTAKATHDPEFNEELQGITSWYNVLSEAQKGALLLTFIQHTSDLHVEYFRRALKQRWESLKLPAVEIESEQTANSLTMEEVAMAKSIAEFDHLLSEVERRFCVLTNQKRWGTLYSLLGLTTHVQMRFLYQSLQRLPRKPFRMHVYDDVPTTFNRSLQVPLSQAALAMTGEAYGAISTFEKRDASMTSTRPTHNYISPQSPPTDPKLVRLINGSYMDPLGNYFSQPYIPVSTSDLSVGKTQMHDGEPRTHVNRGQSSSSQKREREDTSASAKVGFVKQQWNKLMHPRKLKTKDGLENEKTRKSTMSANSVSTGSLPKSPEPRPEQPLSAQRQEEDETVARVSTQTFQGEPDHLKEEGLPLLVALSDHRNVRPEELNFFRGEIIKLIGMQRDREWGIGWLRGNTGVFPMNLVRWLPSTDPLYV